jgi:hypothetical protein
MKKPTSPILPLGIASLALFTISSRAATFVWTNSAGGKWSVATNWDPNRVPGPSDQVMITNGGVYAVTLDFTAMIKTLALGGASGEQTLAGYDSGLVLNSGVVNANGIFSLSNATLACPAMDVTGVFNCAGGTLSAQSQLTVSPLGVLNVMGNGMSIYGVLFNRGKVFWQGGEVDVWNAGTTNCGVVWNQENALWDMRCDALMENPYHAGTPFFNAGTLRKTAGLGTTTLDVYLDNSGTSEAQSGTLILNAGSNLGGSFLADAGAGITLARGSYRIGPGADFSGAGTFQATGGNLTLINDVNPNLQLLGGTVTLDPSFQEGTITALALSGATLAGTNTVKGSLMLNDVSVNGSLTVLAGGSVNWSGRLAATCILTVQSNGVLYVAGNGMYLSGPLTNQGTVFWQDGDISLLNDAAAYFGAIWNQPGGVWNIQCDNRIYNGYYDATFHNAGLVRKTNGLGTTSINVFLDNSGLVEANRGTLSLNGGSNLGGSLRAGAGAGITLEEGSYSVGPAVDFSGPGTFQAAGANVTLLTGVVTNLELAGGTIALDPGFQGGTITNLSLSGGTLAGNNTVQGSLVLNDAIVNGSLTVLAGGSVNWSGRLAATGILTVQSNGVLYMAGNGMPLSGPLTNQGTVFWQGGDISLLNDAAAYFGAIWNQPGGMWNIQCDNRIYNGYYDATFHNAGTVCKSQGLGTTAFEVAVDNSGTLDARSGIISFTSAFTQTTGTWRLALDGPEDYGQITFTNAPLSGALVVVLTNGYFPSANDSFALVGYGSYNGSFSNVSLPAGGIGWQTRLGTNAFTLAVTNLALPAGGASFAWVGGVSSDWFTAGNWSPAGVPGPRDTANITNGATVALSTSATVATLNLSSSSLNGGGALTVLSNCNWNGWGLMCSLTIASNAVLNLLGSGMNLYSPLTNQGTVHWQGGALNVYNDGVNTSGAIWNQAGALWDIECEQGAFGASGTRLERFHNAGVVRKSAGLGTSSLYLYLDNSGMLEAQGGTVSLEGGSNLGGSFLADAGAGIALGGGSFSVGPGVSFSGAGTFQASGGKLTLFTNVLANLQLNGGTIALDPSFQGGTITNLALSGGTLVGNNTVQGSLTLSNAVISGALTVLARGSLTCSGTVFDASSTLTVSAGGALNVLGSGLVVAGVLTNQGTVLLQGGWVLVDNDGASVFGAIWNMIGGSWEIQCDQGVVGVNSSTGAFHNAGVVLKSGGVGTTGLAVYLDNSGVVEAQCGTVSLEGGSNLGGSFVADPGAGIALGAGSYSVGPSVNFSGAGTFQASGGQVTLFTNAVASLQLNGGIVAVDPSFQGGAITNLTLSAGTLAGNNTVRGSLALSNILVTGTLTVLDGGVVSWSGAELGPNGILTVSTNGVLNVQGSGMSLYSPLTNQGTVHWQGGILNVYNNGASTLGVIWNQAGALWDIECEQWAYGASGTGLERFHNAGTVRKSTGVGVSTFYVSVDNLGTLDVQSGTLNLAGPYTLEPTGAINFGINGLADFGQITLIAGGTLAGTVGANINGGYLPEVGDRFAFLSYPSSNGAFAHLNLPADVAWQTNYSANAFTLSVSDVLRLAPINEQQASLLAPLSLRVYANEAYAPPRSLTFTLLSAPAGMSLNPYTGAICWSPAPDQAPSNYTVVLLVTNNGYPPLRATDSFTVIAQPTVLGEDPEWGFEYPAMFVGWSNYGSAFANGPVPGDWLPVWRIPELQSRLQTWIGGDYWRQVTYSVGHKGHGWVCTAAQIQGCGADAGMYNPFDEALTGSLVSQSFLITRNYITFLIGGANDSANLRVELLVQSPSGPVAIEGADYDIAGYATGHGRELMRREWFPVSVLRGSTARIRILDSSATGHLNVDDFRFTDLAPADQTVMIGATTYAAVFQDPSGFYYDWDSPVWGFADLHAHPVSCLGFGWKVLHGAPDGAVFDFNHDPDDITNALSDCNSDHGGWDALHNTSGDYVRNAVINGTDPGGYNPHTEGWNDAPMVRFRQWPVFDSITHQQMWYEWIKRAYDGGQRVMVALAVNNELLAAISKGDGLAPRDDLTSGDLQISAMTAFAARHSDFMAIAHDPAELRSIVRSNMMAIILGSELDDIGNLVRNRVVQPGAPADAASKAAVSQAIQHLYDEGVRYIFPVHLADNAFGGTGSGSGSQMLDIGSKYLNHGQAIEVTSAAKADDIQTWLDNIWTGTGADIASTLQGIGQELNSLPAGLGTPLELALTGLLVGTTGLLTPFETWFSASFPQAPQTAGAALGSGFMPLVAILLSSYLADPGGTLDTVMNLLGMYDVDKLVAANLLPIPQTNYPTYPNPPGGGTVNGVPEALYGVLNVKGLTPLGLYAVQEMMKRGMMLDVDHMSQRAVDDAFNIATNVPGGYPLNSGHNGYREMGFQNCENSRSTNQLPILQQLGGLLGVGWADDPAGYFSRDFSQVVSHARCSSSSIANDCAGTSKTWAQLYLYALEQFHGANVAFGTDMDGFVQPPGPRFGPQSAYGLISADGPGQPPAWSGNQWLRSSQIGAQRNGVLYTDSALLTTPAFLGRAVDYSQDPLNGWGDPSGSVDSSRGYRYNGEQADFFAALNIFYSLMPSVQGGPHWSLSDVEGLLDQNNDLYQASPDSIEGALSPSYESQGDGNGNGLGFAAAGDNHRRHRIIEFADGLFKGYFGADASEDCLIKWVVPAQQLGIAVYDVEVLGDWSKATNEMTGYTGVCSDGGYWDNGGYLNQLNQLLAVWDEYQHAFGANTPLTHCATQGKEWDINYEGVAHYGLFPDFLQDLSNVGLQPRDMSVLFHSAEAFAQMWVKCLQCSYALQPHFGGGGDGGRGAITPLPNGTLQISYVAGFDGSVVEESVDLKNWQPANVLSSVTNGMVCTIQVPATARARFYRLRHP